jgi:hypothetical protein
MKISQLLFSKTPLSKKSRECKHDFPDIKPPPLKKIFWGAFGAQLRRRCIGVRSDRRELPITKSLQRFFQKNLSTSFCKNPFSNKSRECHQLNTRISGYRVCIKFDRGDRRELPQEILYKDSSRKSLNFPF